MCIWVSAMKKEKKFGADERDEIPLDGADDEGADEGDDDDEEGAGEKRKSANFNKIFRCCQRKGPNLCHLTHCLSSGEGNSPVALSAPVQPSSTIATPVQAP